MPPILNTGALGVNRKSMHRFIGRAAQEFFTRLVEKPIPPVEFTEHERIGEHSYLGR